ncbi:ATP-binding protein [Lysobacter arvi]|uniref:histidine kinase n=1 Tax=Lysobacter arvi TaxID=3038776 RepID=A0ABU1C9A8_9GAMM|nr:transporter substrate-binding domain-containing protein [Lysobacter arvi]MDR0181773.1 transporter substrate-binding domain-containing protein [Lysobacter arvi]
MLLFLTLLANRAHAAALELTPEERDWLRAHPTITVATYQGGWAPFERYENDTLTGLGPAYLRNIARQLGVGIVVREYPSWEAAFNGGCRREVDVLMNVSLVPERTPCLVFTASYVEALPVAVGLAARGDLIAPDRLAAARIAVDRGTSVERATRARFPDAQIVTVTDAREGFDAVKQGKADVFFGNPHVARAALARGEWPSLAVLAPIDLPADTLHFAVPDDRKPLASMIDKALSRITSQQRLAYEHKWLGTPSLPMPRAGRVPLTQDEQLWLQRIPPPRIGYARDWEPVTFTGSDGHLSGVAAEYLQMMRTRLGLPLGRESSGITEELRGMMRRGEVDLVAMPASAPVGTDWVRTEPFARMSAVIVMRNRSRPISGLDDLDGKRIAIVGPSRAARVKAKLPNAIIVPVPGIPAGLKAVERGDADAYVGDMMSADRPLRRGQYPTLRLAAPAGFDEDLVFAVRGEYQPLVPLINRMLDTLSAEERQRIRSGWLEVQVSSGVKWRTVAIGAALAALLVAVLAFAYLRTRTEIRRREKTDSLMRDLTRNLPGVIFKLTRDASGTYGMPFIAGNTLALFGMDHEELAAQPREAFASLVHTDDRARLVAALDASFADLSSVEMDFRTTSPDPERWIRISAVARRLDDGLVHWSGYWVDVTASHRQAEALESARQSAENAALARSNFLAAMSHEIRTPMAGINSIIEILSRGHIDDDQRYLIGLVQDYAQALRRILDDVLDMSRIEAGGLELESVETDLRVLVSNSVELVLDLSRRKQLRCICHIDPTLAGLVIVDPTRLRQILLNLLSNAIKFTADGYVAVSLVVLDASDEAQTLCLAVTDSGIGIAPEEQGKLFHPFTQAEVSTSRTYGGSGLGLAISRRLAERMDASLALESTPGVGTRISLTLNARIARQSAVDPALAGRNVHVRSTHPAIADALTGTLHSFGARLVTGEAHAELVLTDAPTDADTRVVRLVADSPEVPRTAIVVEPLLPTHVQRACVLALGDVDATESHPSTRIAMHTGHILVAEDHSTNQLLMERQLAELGFRCRVVSSGEQALAALATEAFDLLITDLQMPGMDGFALARAIRTSEAAEGRPRLPILALSAGVQPEDEARCREAGMDGHLRKPIGLDEMMEQLERWLPLQDGPDASEPTGAISTRHDVEPGDAAAPPSRPAPPLEPALEPLDLAMLTRSFGSRETVCLVAEDLLSNLPADLDDLRQSEHDGDIERMGRALHRITGALGTLGYRNLASDLRVATRIAEAGTQVPPDEIARLLRRIDGTLSELGKFVMKSKAGVD